MSSTNTPHFCHLTIEKKIFGRSSRLIVDIVFLSRYKKIKFIVYIHNNFILDEKLFNFVTCSVEIESFETTPPNTSSTLNFSLSQISYQNNDYRSVLIAQLLFDLFFSSTIDFFNVFSYSKVITLIQSGNFVNLIFNLRIFSFVSKIPKMFGELSN